MVIEQAAELVAVYGTIRVTNVVLAILVLLIAILRLPLWFSAPPAHIKMIGLAAVMASFTVLGSALNHLLRQVDPGPAVFGTLITLFMLGTAVLLAPENDGRPAPILRVLERLGVRVRSRQSRR